MLLTGGIFGRRTGQGHSRETAPNVQAERRILGRNGSRPLEPEPLSLDRWPDGKRNSRYQLLLVFQHLQLGREEGNDLTARSSRRTHGTPVQKSSLPEMTQEMFPRPISPQISYRPSVLRVTGSIDLRALPDLPCYT